MISKWSENSALLQANTQRTRVPCSSTLGGVGSRLVKLATGTVQVSRLISDVIRDVDEESLGTITSRNLGFK